MKTTKTFENASLVSVMNGSIIVKSAAGIEHTFTNASVVSINNGTIIIESEWEPKRGELVKITGTCIDAYCIIDKLDDKSIHCFGCKKIYYNGSCLKNISWRKSSETKISPVTPEEQQAFDDFCKSKGKIWNKEKLQWEKYKWSPKPNECYCYITSWGEVIYRHYLATSLDQYLLQLGNAFPTKEQAQEVAEKVKELFKSL